MTNLLIALAGLIILSLALVPIIGAWLRSRLAGVPVLLLSDYRGSELSDWLDAVPHVVLLHAGIPAAEATIVAREFWQAIGSGKDPQAALEEALAHCAPETSRWVEGRFGESVRA